MPLLAQAQKLIVVLVVIVAVLAMVVGIFIGHGLILVPPNTSTQTWNYYAFQGYGMQNANQLLDASSYATSWSPQDQSEKIVAQGGVTRSFGALSCLKGWQYQVWTSPDGVAWTQVKDSPFGESVPAAAQQPGSSPIAAPALTYQLTGPFSGALKVDFQVHLLDVADPTCSIGLDKGFLTVAEDQAYLVSSSYTLDADRQGQIGQTVHATVSVGYLTSKSGGPGWQLWAYSTAQNKVVLGPFNSGTSAWNQSEQSFEYTIQSSDFSSTAGTCGNGNRIEWHLSNELWPRAWVYTTTIDVSSFAPSFGFDGFTGDAVSNGSITVKFHAAPNPTTQADLSQIVISYGYGSAQVLNLTGNATTANIPLGQNGLLHIEGYAIDAACRPSPTDRLNVYVYPPGQQPPGQGPPNWLVFFGVIVLFAIVGAVVAYYAKGPMWGRVILLFVFLLLGVVLALLLEPKVLMPNTWAAGFIPLFLRGGG